MPEDQVFFDAHLENIMRELKVSPQVVYGEDAVKAASRYGKLGNGAFLWEGGENLVALRNKDSIAVAAHELQHCWQYWHGRKKFRFRFPRKYSKYNNFFRRLGYNLFYVFNAKEIDAERYAVDYCKRNGLPYDLAKAKSRYTLGYVLRTAILLSLCFLGAALVNLYVVVYT